MKVLSRIGNRPQFIKAAPVSRALREVAIDEIVLHTGQHYDAELSEIFIDEFGLPQPTYRLGIGAMPHRQMLARMEPAIVDAIDDARPDWVIVFGDTNSTLAGARAAVACGIRLAHVEAGLRSGDWAMPEERNRIEVDRIATLLLCPDERSRTTLLAEGVAGVAEVVGDVMADVSFALAPIAQRWSRALEQLGVTPRHYLLATIHREANVQMPRLARLVEGLNRLTERVIFPMHPRTRLALARDNLQLADHVTETPPLGYTDLAALASQARVVITDSGGLQKEAYWYRVPCVTPRPSTEWVDTVEVGANRLVDDDPARLVAAVQTAAMPSVLPPLYGDGSAAVRIADVLVGFEPRRT